MTASAIPSSLQGLSAYRVIFARNQAHRQWLNPEEGRLRERAAMQSVKKLAGSLALVLLLSGCAAIGGLLGSSGFRDGASTVASNGGTIIDAVDWVTEPSDSYCRKEAGAASGLVPVYKVTAGDCAVGDSELKEYEYNEIVAENEAKAWEKLHAVALAEAAKPTYCRTAAAGIAYRASAKTCQPGEDAITEEEYAAAKAEAKAAATKLP
jgi:hypothetical protein